MSSSNARPPAQRNWIWPVAIGAVVLLGVLAVVFAKATSKDKAAEVQSQQVSAEITTTGDALPALPDSGDDPAVGKTIPTVTGESFDGSTVTIGPDDGAKVLMFVAHWCPHCQREVPLVMQHLKDQPMPDDVELEIISTAVKPSADNYPPSSWLEREGWKGTVLADSEGSEAATAFGLPGFPYFVAVDADGKVVARSSGEISMDQFDQLVKAAQGTSS